MNRRTARRLVSLLILFVLAFQALPAIAQTSDEPPPDDFIAQLDTLRANDPTYSESFRTANDEWETDTASDNSSIRFEDRTYHIGAVEPNLFVWGLSPADAANFYVEVYADKAAGPANNEFGIVFRHQDTENFYAYLVSSDGYYHLRKLEGNEWTELIPWMASDAIDQSDGATNLVAVYADGPTLLLLINDTVVNRIDDETFTTGGIALGAGSFDEGGVDIAFDDFAMWDLDDFGALTLPPVIPSDTPTGEPTAEPTQEATEEPTAEPTVGPAIDEAAILDRVDTVRAESTTLSEDFRRDTGAWALGVEDASEFQIQRRALSMHIIDSNWLGWSTLQEEQAADLLMEADLRLDSGASATESGIMFRFVDDENFYYYAINGDGSYSLWKLANNEWQELLPWTESAAIDTTEGAVNRLGVLAEGDTISLLINDQVAGQAQDDSFASGQVGLAVGTFEEGDATVIADNVDLWVLAEGPPVTPTPEIAVTPDATETPESDATPQADATPQVEAPPPADDAVERLDAVRVGDPTATSDFRRDDGTWDLNAETDVTHTYTRRALEIFVDRANWISWSLNQDLSVADFLAEVDAGYISGPLDAEYGFVFRYVDDNNLYLFVISADGNYSLFKRTDGQWETLVTWTQSDALNTGNSALNRLGVLAEGSQITLFANSTPLTTVEDDTFATGSIGLAAGTFDDPGLKISFDNFSYWQIDDGG